MYKFNMLKIKYENIHTKSQITKKYIYMELTSIIFFFIKKEKKTEITNHIKKDASKLFKMKKKKSI